VNTEAARVLMEVIRDLCLEGAGAAAAVSTVNRARPITSLNSSFGSSSSVGAARAFSASRVL
jgi:hypothetical protein